MANQHFGSMMFTTVVLVAALSGCASSPVASPPAESGQATATQPMPESTLPSSAYPAPNSTAAPSAFVGQAPAHATRSLSWNTTGDALLRFTMTATKTGAAFPQCGLVVETSFQYLYDAQNAAFFVLSSDGGAFTYGAGQSVHVGPVAPHGVDDGNLHAWRFESGPGDTWGTNTYTIGVLNMTWWKNDVVGDTTLRVTQTCDSPFEISNVTGSRTLNILTEASFHGGVGAGPVLQSVATADKWQGSAVGSKTAMVGLVFGYGPAVHMTVTTSKDSFVWQSANNDANYMVFREIPAGNLELNLDAFSGHLGLVVGDFEHLPLPEKFLPGAT